MKTAFVYHRYSDPNKQAQGYTLETQRNITKELAKKHAAEIIGVYEDKGISGETIDKRPAMMNMLADLSSLDPDYVIVTDQDRFSRGDSFWIIKNEMVKNNVCLITEKEGITNFAEDASKDFMSDILGATSKFYLKLLRLKVKRGNVTRANKGLFIGNLTNVFGYDYDKSSKNLKVNENEASVVKMIFDMYVKGYGFYRISKYLNENGYRTKNKHSFTSATISRIISHPLYCGYIVHLGRVIKGLHEPIISEALYAKAMSQKKENYNRNPKMNIRHLLTGFLFCENCGARMQMSHNCNKDTGSQSYSCSGYLKSECDKPSYIKEYLVETYVIEKVLERINELKIELKGRKVKTSVDKNKMLMLVDNKLKRASDQFIEGEISKSEYNDYKIKYGKEKKEIAKLKEPANIDIGLIKKLKADELFDELEFEQKRKVLSILIDRITVARGRKSKHFYKRISIKWNELLR
jgi:site-specific DNA recombinase